MERARGASFFRSHQFISLVIAAGVAFGIFNNPEKKDNF